MTEVRCESSFFLKAAYDEALKLCKNSYRSFCADLTKPLTTLFLKASNKNGLTAMKENQSGTYSPQSAPLYPCLHSPHSTDPNLLMSQVELNLESKEKKFSTNFIKVYILTKFRKILTKMQGRQKSFLLLILRT